MFDIDTWQEIGHTIVRNKVRSMLTAFGVFWGILMLIILVGLGQGLERGVKSRIGGMATNSVFLWSNRTSEAYKGFKAGRYWQMRNDDIDALKTKFPVIDHISPLQMTWRTPMKFKSGEGEYSLRGLDASYFQINPVEMQSGRYINEIDVLQNRKVCVLGPSAYRYFFPDGGDPSGEYIQINGIYYVIIGHFEVLAEWVQMNGDPADEVHIPYTTFQQVENEGDRLQSLCFTLLPGANFADHAADITFFIKQRHMVAPTDNRALFTMDASELFDQMQLIIWGLQALIWVVGLGTLLGGVVGVSNIMLISVRERTLEIGIRRALGARPLQILLQIMSESLVLTFLAGGFGLLIGVGILVALEPVFAGMGKEVPMELQAISFPTAIAALLVIILCGLIAGILPALRALDIKAIDALRDE